MTSRRTKVQPFPQAGDHPPFAVTTGSSASSSDNESSRGARTSGEQSRIDQEVLDEEEERNRLLTGKSQQEGASFRRALGGNRGPRSRHDTFDDDQKELLYDTEEGGRRSSTPSIASSEEDREKIGYTQARYARGKRQSFCTLCLKYTLISTLIAALFFAISLGAYKATVIDSHHSPSTSQPSLSNGTHTFLPTTILLSLDGFRADFLKRGLTPTLAALIRQGVSPPYMLPSFPSVTFPNHYTMVTGLYPEAHGIVSNSFYDPAVGEEFMYTHPDAMDPKWWTPGKPIWTTAEEQGVRVATHMWPGSEVKGADGEYVASYVDKYNGTETLIRKVDTILGYLDVTESPSNAPETDDIQNHRPQLIAAYIPNVDADGHKYGPNSTEIRTTITAVDTMLSHLLSGLSARNLTSIVNLIVVSDHGMATTSPSRLIQFEDLIDPDLIEHIDGWPHYGLRPKDPESVGTLYQDLFVKAEQIPESERGFDVYTKETMPSRYHFTSSERIAPLWLIPRTGWAIVHSSEYDVAAAHTLMKDGKEPEIYHPQGIHGYDHEHPLMRAIFVARGPAFPHREGSRVEVFQNTNVYNILCDSVGVVPEGNNGTLRLPLKPTGVHGEDLFGGEDEEEVLDPPVGGGKAEENDGLVNPEKPMAPTRPDEPPPEGNGIETHEQPHELTWKEWMKAKTEAIKEWVHEKLGIPKEDLVVVEEPYRGGGPP